MPEFAVHNLSELEPIARQLVALLDAKKVLCFQGDLGAGKTTLIQQIARLIGVEGEVSSPTFALVNTYTSNLGLVYHFDLYRIQGEEELYDIGFEEYLDSGQPCLIEWPEMAGSLLPEDALIIQLHSNREGERRIGW